MTIDGVSDHTAVIPDEEIHQHYTDLLSGAGAILYGRITYELMRYWQTLLKNPSGEKSMNDFAVAIDRVQKIVFSHSLKDTEWESAELSNKSLEAEVTELRQQPGKDVFIGSRSLIIQLMKQDMIDEFQLCVHPVVAGSGLPLFENMNNRTVFKLIKTKIFQSGAVVLYYELAGR